jgi:hypothetical protein
MKIIGAAALAVAGLAGQAHAQVAYSSYKGFVVHDTEIPGGIYGGYACMALGALDKVENGGPGGYYVQFEACSKTSTSIVLGAQNQIMLDGLCLQDNADGRGTPELMPCVAEGASAFEAQQWIFQGGVLQSYSSGDCLWADGFQYYQGNVLDPGQLKNAAFGDVHSCRPQESLYGSGGTNTNIFQPIGYPLDFIPQGNPMLCLTNLKSGYNNGVNDTALQTCASGWLSSRLDQTWRMRFVLDQTVSGFSDFIITSDAGGEALEVYKNQFSGGVGIVDLADPVAPVVRQHWLLTTTGSNIPAQGIQLVHGSGLHCLNAWGNTMVTGETVQAYVCGTGDDPANQWAVTVSTWGHY